MISQVQRETWAGSRSAAWSQPRVCLASRPMPHSRCLQTAYIGESGRGNPPVIGIDGLLAVVADVGRLRELQAEATVWEMFPEVKREETKRLARIAPVDLGIPVIAAPR
jgi:hypothetical protein